MPPLEVVLHDARAHHADRGATDDRLPGDGDVVAQAHACRHRARVAEPLHHRPMDSCRWRTDHQVIGRQLARCQRMARQRHVGVGEPAEPAEPDRNLLDMRLDQRLRDDREVERALVQLVAQGSRVADEDRRRDRRIALLEAAEHVGQAEQREVLADADAQQATQRVARTKALAHLGLGLEHAVGVGQQRMGLGGRRDARPVAHEERRVERRLELADALRDARLRQTQLLGSAREAAEADDALERAQLIQGDVHDWLFLSSWR